MIKYALYLRLFIETHESMLLSATSEIKTMRFSEASHFISLIFTLAFLAFSIILPILAFFQFWKRRNHYDSKTKFYFMEFFADLRNSKYARMYMPMLLTRRVIFV